MRLSALREELSRALSKPKTQKLFEEARRRHPALEDVPTPFVLLAILEDAGASGFDRQDEVLRALVHEYQTSPWPRLWMTIIACAFMPTIIAVRARARRGSEAPDELDSQLLYAFQEAVAAYALDRRPGSVAAGLKWATWKTYFRNLERSQEARRLEQELVAYAARVSEPGAERFDPSDHELPDEDAPAFDEDDLAEMRAVLDNLVADGALRPDDADLIWETRLGGDTAASYARRTAGPDQAAVKREQERLRRRRSRAEKRLRRALEQIVRRGVSRSCP